MVSTININPMATTNAPGTFGVTSVGYIQGIAMDDPAVRYALAGGILDTTETLPMWGSVGIGEYVPGVANAPSSTLGGTIKRATVLTGMTGLSVFNQDHSMINTPQSQVPLATSGMSVHFYRFGSGARIPVAVAPSLVSLQGGLISAQVSWDFANSELVPYTPAYANTTITGATWASTSGGQATFTVSTDLTAVLSAGSVIDVSAVVSTGGTGLGYNGNWVVVSVTSTTIVVTMPGASSPGTYSSGGIVAGGGGALPCKILDVSLGNSMTVTYAPSTGFVNWNRSGNAALILI